MEGVDINVELSSPELASTIAIGHLSYTNRIALGTNGYAGINTFDLYSSDVNICGASGAPTKSFKIFKSFGDGIATLDGTKILCSFRSTGGD